MLHHYLTGFTIKKSGDQIQPGCSDLPKLPEGLVVRLSDLGGNTGKALCLLSKYCIYLINPIYYHRN